MTRRRLLAVAALLHVIKHAERMGDQCVNIAKLVPLAGHEPPADARGHAVRLRLGHARGGDRGRGDAHRRLSDDEAEAFFRAYEVGVQNVGENALLHGAAWHDWSHGTSGQFGGLADTAERPEAR